MSVQPPHLPASEAELDDWSVYADYLLTIGDRRGELMAIDLALPAIVDADDVIAYQTKARASCPLQAAATRVVWSLAHVRALDILGTFPSELRREAGPDETTLATVARSLGSPLYRCLEHLAIVYFPDEHAAHWRRLFAALPPACRELVVRMPRDEMTGPQLAELIAILPPQIRTLGLLELPRQAAAMHAIVAELATDRFEVVHVTSSAVDEPALAAFATALARTRTVRLRTSVLTGPHLANPRMELDSVDAALASNGYAIGLRRWTPIELQERFGYIPIRAQLAAQLPETHRILLGREGWPYASRGGTIVRRGAAWTLVGDVGAFIDDIPITADRVGSITDGCRVRCGNLDARVFLRDASSRARATAR